MVDIAADHAHSCYNCCNVRVNNRHNAFPDLWLSFRRQAVCRAGKEQSVPELGSGIDILAGRSGSGALAACGKNSTRFLQQFGSHCSRRSGWRGRL